MKRVLTACLLLAVSLFGSGQVVLNVTLPPIGLTTKAQLWNLSLANTSATSLLVQVEMNVTDASNNQLVFTGTTRIFTLPVGIKQLQTADIQPITYNVVSPNYGVNSAPDGFLPVGQFSICYNLIKIYSDLSERLVEECQNASIDPLSPPQLITPEDSEQVAMKRPAFAWMPPSPRHLFNNLNYDWSVVEILPTQTAAEALTNNIPFFYQSSILSTSFQYPTTAPTLDSSKLYAWRVIAKNNEVAVGTSESWIFKFKGLIKADSLIHVESKIYADVSTNETSSYSMFKGVVRFRFDNIDNHKNLSLRLFDIGGKTRREISLDTVSIPVSYGENYLQIDLSNKNELENLKMYLLEIATPRNEKYILKFIYSRPQGL
jgi:hypothetical protein